MEELREVLLFCLLYAGALGAALAYTVKPGEGPIPIRSPGARRPKNEVF